MLVGVLGLGSIGLRHARNLLSLGCDVSGYDPSPVACRAFEVQLSRATVERTAVLTHADAIVVASPNQHHLDDIRDVITIGKPVLVEKPLGHDPDLAERLAAHARERGVAVAVAHNLRFRPVVQRVKQILLEGALGNPAWARFCCASWLPDWRPGQDYRSNYAADPLTGGVIFDSIHELDLACHLLGRAKVHAASAARTGILDIPSEDVADILLRHDSGCQSTIHLDYITRPRQRVLEIGGPYGTLTADLRDGTLTMRAPDGTTRLNEAHPSDPNGEYVSVVADFLSAVSRCVPPACPVSDALETLRLACAARGMAGLPQASGAVLRQNANA